MLMRRVLLIVFLLLSVVPMAAARDSLPATTSFDVEKATEAYVARVSPEKRARSDAYFEGGYWLTLWQFLYGAALFLALLHFRIAARLRTSIERIAKRRFLQIFLYWSAFLLIVAVMTSPLSIYAGFVREHHYGLSTQSFGDWSMDQLKALVVQLIFGGLMIAAVYRVLARFPRTWWVWGTLVVIIFLIIGVVIAPVFIDPLFNEYTPLTDPKVRDPILRMAHANGIDVTNVYVVDASRQTTRISANVSGMFGTERIALNDNLLRRCSLAEIKSVMGHEIGHYVLNHIGKMLVFFALVILFVFLAVQKSTEGLLARYGERWNITSVSDPASLPLLALLFSFYVLVVSPVTTSIIRIQEVEADAFGLNAAREPDGFAEVSLKLGEYRKLAPGPIEELIFFDHPSGRSRIRMAMRWKAANMGPASTSGGTSGRPTPR